MTTLKVLLAGSSKSGKTTLTNSLLPPNHHNRSSDVAFHTFGDWDRFMYTQISQHGWNWVESLGTYFQTAHKLLLCVNVANAESFQLAQQWLQTHFNMVPSYVTIVLIATNCDQEPVVTHEQLQQLASDHNFAAYIRVNALDPEHQGVVRLKRYLLERLNGLAAKEAFPEKLPYYHAFLKEQLSLLQPLISIKRDQSLSSGSLLGLGKKKADANREFQALNDLKKGMDQLLNQSPEIVYDLEGELTKIIDKVKAKDPGAFDKHVSFASVRPLSKAQRFCNDLLDGARGATSTAIQNHNNNW